MNTYVYFCFVLKMWIFLNLIHFGEGMKDGDVLMGKPYVVAVNVQNEKKENKTVYRPGIVTTKSILMTFYDGQILDKYVDLKVRFQYKDEFDDVPIKCEWVRRGSKFFGNLYRIDWWYDRGYENVLIKPPYNEEKRVPTLEFHSFDNTRCYRYGQCKIVTDALTIKRCIELNNLKPKTDDDILIQGLNFRLTTEDYRAFVIANDELKSWVIGFAVTLPENVSPEGTISTSNNFWIQPIKTLYPDFKYAYDKFNVNRNKLMDWEESVLLLLVLSVLGMVTKFFLNIHPDFLMMYYIIIVIITYMGCQI